MNADSTEKRRIMDLEKHRRSLEVSEEASLAEFKPNVPMLRRTVDNAMRSHNQFLKWLSHAEAAASGLNVPEVTLRGFPIDRMGSEHAKRLRFLVWEIAIFNLEYWQAKAAMYVTLEQPEKVRSGAARLRFQEFKEAMEVL